MAVICIRIFVSCLFVIRSFMFPTLNLPAVDLRLQNRQGFKNLDDFNSLEVFDCIRKKYVTLTPEEWVRQHVIHFLISEKKYPKGLIEVEKSIKLFNTEKRVDILVRKPDLMPLLLVECKAPDIKLKQAEVNQLTRYQITLNAPYCMLTNGTQHFVIASGNGKTIFLKDLPNYTKINKLPFK